MKTLVDKSRVVQAVKAFRTKLDSLAVGSERLEWAFPNGAREKYKTYKLESQYGTVEVGIPTQWGTRIPHLLRLATEQSLRAPDVELNIPLESDRRVSGVYAQSDQSVWLCSRGTFTAFRGRIPQEYSHAHFVKWLRDSDDAGRSAALIPVVSMDSPTFADDIATFVRAVVNLKTRFKAGVSAPSELTGDSADWSRGKEFEGRKVFTRSASTSEYEYLHGPICNRLEDCLRQVIGPDQEFGRNSHIDAAIVEKASKLARCIFEVKTAALPSQQIYTAVGQLFYYRHLYGRPTETKLLLVLPDLARSMSTEKFVEPLGVSVVYEIGRTFLMSSGQALEDWLAQEAI